MNNKKEMDKSKGKISYVKRKHIDVNYEIRHDNGLSYVSILMYWEVTTISSNI